jgi:hypothetical protein
MLLLPCTSLYRSIVLQVFYGTPATHEVKGVWCHPCYQEIKTDTVPLAGFTIRKANLEKRKNDDEVRRRKCRAWVLPCACHEIVVRSGPAHFSSACLPACLPACALSKPSLTPLPEKLPRLLHLRCSVCLPAVAAHVCCHWAACLPACTWCQLAAPSTLPCLNIPPLPSAFLAVCRLRRAGWRATNVRAGCTKSAGCSTRGATTRRGASCAPSASETVRECVGVAEVALWRRLCRCCMMRRQRSGATLPAGGLCKPKPRRTWLPLLLAATSQLDTMHLTLQACGRGSGGCQPSGPRQC